MTFEEKDMNQQGHFHKNTASSHKKSKKSPLYYEQPSVTLYFYIVVFKYTLYLLKEMTL